MNIQLWLHLIFNKKLHVGEKVFEVHSSGTYITTMGELIERGTELQPANKDELLSFAKKYHPSGWFSGIYGAERGRKTLSDPFPADIYKISGETIKRGGQSWDCGVPPAGTLILFVRNH